MRTLSWLPATVGALALAACASKPARPPRTDWTPSKPLPAPVGVDVKVRNANPFPVAVKVWDGNPDETRLLGAKDRLAPGDEVAFLVTCTTATLTASGANVDGVATKHSESAEGTSTTIPAVSYSYLEVKSPGPCTGTLVVQCEKN